MMQDTRNAARFSGFAATYDRARPAAPLYPVQLLTRYLGRAPGTVVDLGCGTGLSTLAWRGNCAQVIGIEPSEDMRREAEKKAAATVTFRPGFGNATGLPAESADIVVCSQSFHWMEPVSTLREVARILVPGGIFAAIDCDWPPSVGWQAEQAFMQLYEKVRRLETELPTLANSFVRYEKSRHLTNIRQSGHFRYARELLFANTEPCTPQRLFALLLSQGSTQAICRQQPALLEEDIAHLQALLPTLLPPQFPAEFNYRMRMAVK